MDIIDRAQTYQEKAISAAIEDHQRRAAEIQSTEDNTHCARCGDEIPAARRKAVPGCRLCVGCQQEAER
jgi:phage/conjugal plasmid C-4 type zinc finger TraR family protein